VNDTLELEFLGTGTSTGVPQIRCTCEVCRSSDARNKRLRASVIVRYRGARLLIDCGPDFRTQILRASDSRLDALLLTHVHYDHVAGIDDLRIYGSARKPFPVYAQDDVCRDLRHRIPYCFAREHYPSAAYLSLHTINPRHPFTVAGVEVRPIPVMHGKLPIVGFRIGPLAYITDAKEIAPAVIDSLRGVPLLVLNALHIAEHPTHLNLEQALDIVKRIAPGEAYLTHMSHHIGLHAVVDPALPHPVHLAHDTLLITH